MSISIQNFRALTTDPSNLDARITVGQNDQGGHSVRASSGLFGRFVDWVKGTNIDGDAQAQNRGARVTFYNALAKAEGPDFADRIIQEAYGYDSVTFRQKTTGLYGDRISLALDTADRMRAENLAQTNSAAHDFINSDDWAAIVQDVSENAGHPGIDPKDREVQNAFFRQVRFNPEYGREKFDIDDLRGLARDAVRVSCDAKRARFNEQYPSLGQLPGGHFRDSQTFFGKVREDLRAPPLDAMRKSVDAMDGAKWLDDALDKLEESTKLLGTMKFDPTDAAVLQGQVNELNEKLLELATNETAINDSFDTLKEQVANQIGSELFGVIDGLGLSDQATKDIKHVLLTEFQKALDLLSETPELGVDKREWQKSTIDYVVDHAIDDVLLDAGMDFGQRTEVRTRLKTELENRFEQANNGPLRELGEAQGKALQMQTVLKAELYNQIGKLAAKSEFLDEYMQHDPLSDKSVAYNELVLKQASKLVLDDALEQLNAKMEEEGRKPPNQSDPDRVNKLNDHIASLLEQRKIAGDRVEDARHKWENAGTGRTVSPEKSKDKEHPLNKVRSDEVRFLSGALKEAKISLPGSIRLPSSDSVVSEHLTKMQVKALDTMQDWHTISRDMMVSRDGLSRTYRSVITPGSQLGNIVGQSYQDDGLHGVSAGNKTESGHARNLQVSELYRIDRDDEGEEVPVKVSQTIRHGVLDPWSIKNAEDRTQASRNGASEVIDTAVISNKDFKDRLLEKSLLIDGNQQPPSKLVHVNLNLTTADEFILRKFAPDYRENDFTQNQFDAFEAQNGARTMTIRDNDNEDRQVQMEVDTITFSFGVNKLAMGKEALGLIPEDTLWPPEIVEHNRANLTKLVGDLTVRTEPGGYIGGLVDRLKAQRDDGQTSPQERAALNDLIGKIQRETDDARNMFNSGAYKGGLEDAYKMNRTLQRLVNLGGEALQKLGDNDNLMTVSQGCKSNKDRGGMEDVEHKSQVIIEDMGGRVRHGQEFSAQDQTIYNTVLTSSGQAEVQQLNTGLPGSKNAGELHARINDPDAQKYAEGFAHFTKA